MTVASLLLKQGVYSKIVQERLGHANIKITLDVYSHIVPGIQQAAANKFAEIVMSRVDKSEPFTAKRSGMREGYVLSHQV